MNKKFTFLMAAAIMLLALFTQPLRAVGQTSSTADTLVISSYAQANTWGDGTRYMSASVGLVSFQASSSGTNQYTGLYVSSSNSWKFYQTDSGKLTISVPSGYTLNSAKFTFTNNNSGTLKYGTSTVTSGTAVSLSGRSAEFSISRTGNGTNGQILFTVICVTYSSNTTSSEVYSIYTGNLVEGDYVIYNTNGAMKSAISNGRLANQSVSFSDGQILNPINAIVWHIASAGNYWTIYNDSIGKYAAFTTSNGAATLLEEVTDYAKWSVTPPSSGSNYAFVNKGKSGDKNYLRQNGDYGWASYVSTTGNAPTLYKKVVNVTLSVASVENGAITATPTGGTAIAEGASSSVVTGTAVNLNATGEGNYVLDAWDVYKTGDSQTKISVTNNTFTMPNYDVSVSASFRLPTTFVVQYSVNGTIVDALTQSNVAEGSSVTLPTSSQVTPPMGFTFAGWSESENSEIVISGTTYTPSENKTLYLVFVESGQTFGYNKVSSLDNITPGKYIIVNANYCLPSVTTTSSPVKSSDYAVSNASNTSNYSSVPANTEWVFTGINSAMTIKNSEGKYLYSNSDNKGLRVSTTSDTWAFETNGNGFAMKESNNNRYCATYKDGDDWRSYDSKTATNYDDGGVLYIYKKTPAYTRVFTMDIDKDTWYFIASPVGTVPVNMDDLTDLYFYDEATHYWMNKKVGDNAAGFDFVLGKGYLAAYHVEENPEDQITLTFAGTSVCTDATKPVGVVYHGTIGEETNPLAGWNLVGNPYPHAAYLSQSFYMTAYDTENSKWVVQASTAGTVATCAGAMVKVDSGVTSVLFSKNAPSAPNNGSVKISLGQQVMERGSVSSTLVDNAIVSFNEGNELPKFYFMEQNANLYIPQGEKEYAIATSDGQGEMPLNFRANADGQYTLTVNPEGVEMNYLHLIDNMTGNDIDLLQTPSYSFNAKTTDYESRFRLVFAANNESGVSAGSTTFAYYSNGNWMVNNEGEATLQVIDVMGRVLSNQTISGTAELSLNQQPGVYVLRLVNGNDVKTQKIVVR